AVTAGRPRAQVTACRSADSRHQVLGFIFSWVFAPQVVQLAHSGLVEALLHAGADPNARDRVLKLTVTHDAAREGFVDTVRVLTERSADVNLVDDRGNLPLHLAAREGHLEVVRLLIGLTANPRAPNAQGSSPWQLAHDFRRKEAAELISGHLPPEGSPSLQPLPTVPAFLWPHHISPSPNTTPFTESADDALRPRNWRRGSSRAGSSAAPSAIGTYFLKAGGLRRRFVCSHFTASFNCICRNKAGRP
uniref:Cyclin-dependent kinase inhibitor 2C (p18, inhibits CDK4) n=1 Tax=Oryzias sinensis TaxID=183150 RepID=A0A8C7YST6_9TELE